MVSSTLRLSDLGKRPEKKSRMLNVRLPIEITNAIDNLAVKFGCTKTALFVALINEGFDAGADALRELGTQPPAQGKKGRKRK